MQVTRRLFPVWFLDFGFIAVGSFPVKYYLTNSMMLVANRCLLPEGALKSSDGGGRSGDVENARLDHSTFAVRRPAIQDPIILTEFLHKTCLRHYVCFELICLISVFLLF